MKQLNAIEIEDSDFLAGTENKHWQSAMTKEANDGPATFLGGQRVGKTWHCNNRSNAKPWAGEPLPPDSERGRH